MLDLLIHTLSLRGLKQFGFFLKEKVSALFPLVFSLHCSSKEVEKCAEDTGEKILMGFEFGPGGPCMLSDFVCVCVSMCVVDRGKPGSTDLSMCN